MSPWVWAFFFLLSGMQATARMNFTIINPEVDAALEKGPIWFWDTFAIVSITVGGKIDSSFNDLKI